MEGGLVPTPAQPGARGRGPCVFQPWPPIGCRAWESVYLRRAPIKAPPPPAPPPPPPPGRPPIRALGEAGAPVRSVAVRRQRKALVPGRAGAGGRSLPPFCFPCCPRSSCGASPAPSWGQSRKRPRRAWRGWRQGCLSPALGRAHVPPASRSAGLTSRLTSHLTPQPRPPRAPRMDLREGLARRLREAFGPSPCTEYWGASDHGE